MSGPADHPHNVGYRGEPCKPPAGLEGTARWEWKVKWNQGRMQAESEGEGPLVLFEGTGGLHSTAERREG